MNLDCSNLTEFPRIPAEKLSLDERLEFSPDLGFYLVTHFYQNWSHPWVVYVGLSTPQGLDNTVPVGHRDILAHMPKDVPGPNLEQIADFFLYQRAIAGGLLQSLKCLYVEASSDDRINFKMTFPNGRGNWEALVVGDRVSSMIRIRKI